MQETLGYKIEELNKLDAQEEETEEQTARDEVRAQQTAVKTEI